MSEASALLNGGASAVPYGPSAVHPEPVSPLNCSRGATDSPQRRRVLQVGTFDVENFGDALFPLIARWRLADAAAEWVIASPTARKLCWADALPTKAIEDVASDARGFDLVLLGGGDLVHVEWGGPYYELDFASAWTAYAALWMGASVLAARWDCTAAWNCPGVPYPVPDAFRMFFSREENPVRYWSVRDELCVENLPAAVRSGAHIVPDTIAEISRMWPVETLQQDLRDAFAAIGEAVPGRYCCFHVNGGLFDAMSPEVIARAIGELARQFSAVPVLVCPGPCHDDVPAARKVFALLGEQALLIAETATLRALAAVLAHALAYAGSSLHGWIVASSYAVPAVSVMPSDRAAWRKLAGHHAMAGFGRERIFESWDAIPLDADTWARWREEARNYLPVLQAKLDAHWAEISALVGAPRANEATPAGADWLHRNVAEWAPAAGAICTRMGERIAQLQRQISAADAQPRMLAVQQEEKLAEQARMLADQDARLAAQTRMVADQDARLAAQTRMLADQDARLGAQARKLAEQAGRLAAQMQVIADQDRKLAEQERNFATEALANQRKSARIKLLRSFLELLRWVKRKPLFRLVYGWRKRMRRHRARRKAAPAAAQK